MTNSKGNLASYQGTQFEITPLMRKHTNYHDTIEIAVKCCCFKY